MFNFNAASALHTSNANCSLQLTVNPLPALADWFQSGPAPKEPLRYTFLLNFSCLCSASVGPKVFFRREACFQENQCELRVF